MLIYLYKIVTKSTILKTFLMKKEYSEVKSNREICLIANKPKTKDRFKHRRALRAPLSAPCGQNHRHPAACCSQNNAGFHRRRSPGRGTAARMQWAPPGRGPVAAAPAG